MPPPSVWVSFWTVQPMWPSWESHLAGCSCRQSEKGGCGVLFVVKLQWFLYTLSTWCDVMQGGSNIFRAFLADTAVDECRIQCWSNFLKIAMALFNTWGTMFSAWTENRHTFSTWRTPCLFHWMGFDGDMLVHSWPCFLIFILILGS